MVEEEGGSRGGGGEAEEGWGEEAVHLVALSGCYKHKASAKMPYVLCHGGVVCHTPILWLIGLER